MKYLICIMMALMLPFAAQAEDNHYDGLGFYGEYDMWPVQRDGLWGFIDHTGKLIIPCEWAAGVIDVVDGRARVGVEGACGVIDSAGRLLVSCEWDHIVPELDGGYTVLKNGYAGALAADGSVVIPCDRFTSVGPVINGVRKCGVDGLFGLCTATGEIIVDCLYLDVDYFSDGWALVMQGEDAFWIDETGAMVLDRPKGYKSHQFTNGYTCVINENGLYGVMDKSGTFVIPCEWTEGVIWPFAQQEIAPMWTNTHYAFFNKQGKMVTGGLHERGSFKYAINGAYLYLIEAGELSIWHADGTQIY